jgi:hypothetical protein
LYEEVNPNTETGQTGDGWSVIWYVIALHTKENQNDECYCSCFKTR